MSPSIMAYFTLWIALTCFAYALSLSLGAGYLNKPNWADIIFIILLSPLAVLIACYTYFSETIYPVLKLWKEDLDNWFEAAVYNQGVKSGQVYIRFTGEYADRFVVLKAKNGFAYGELILFDLESNEDTSLHMRYLPPQYREMAVSNLKRWKLER